jgi:hypothetical protein
VEVGNLTTKNLFRCLFHDVLVGQKFHQAMKWETVEIEEFLLLYTNNIFSRCNFGEFTRITLDWRVSFVT